jgi:hypothetical protein
MRVSHTHVDNIKGRDKINQSQAGRREIQWSKYRNGQNKVGGLDLQCLQWTTKGRNTRTVGFTFQTLSWRGFVLNVFVGTIETVMLTTKLQLKTPNGSQKKVTDNLKRSTNGSFNSFIASVWVWVLLAFGAVACNWNVVSWLMLDFFLKTKLLVI